MKKIFIIFTAIILCAPIWSAQSAVTIKKATPVATKASSDSDTSASLVPTVIGLVTGVMDMNAKQNKLSADCIPTTAERTFVDTMMKEWAKTGRVNTKYFTILRRNACGANQNYAMDVQFASAPGVSVCYDTFNTESDMKNIWAGFPKVGFASYCKNAETTCGAGDKITMSDTYDLFALIDFGPDDYTKQEATMAGKLLNKVESCTSSKLSAKKKALWGEFIINTAGNVGKKTNTGTIMDQVGGITGGGAGGAMGSLGGIAAQFMNK